MTDNGTESGDVAEVPDGLLEVGHIGKAHGLKGDVMVYLSTNRPERVAAGSTLESEQGSLVVARSQPHKNAFLVHFEGINSREKAEAVRGTALWAEPMDDPDVVWAHEVIGAVLTDQDGNEHGRVEAMEANPASDLLVLEGGGLVPVRFVTEITPGELVVAEIPDGLL